MSVPLWRFTSSPREVRCDVAVLGGGITGLGAAIALEERGLDALVIERAEIASGASGRNAGYLMRGAADNYAAAVRELGRERAKALWRWTEDNLRMLRARGIEREFFYRSVPSCLLATAEDELAELRASHTMMREDGFEVEWIESGADALWRSGVALGGLVNPNDAACNPCDMLRFLTSQLRRPPLTHQEVRRIVLHAGGVRLETADTTIIAGRCLVCLNAFTPLLFPALAPLIQPKRGQILALRTRGRVFDHSYYANHGYEYFRQTSDDTAIMGGWRKPYADTEVGYEERITDGVQRGLEEFAQRILGEPIEVVSRWSGTMGFTPDGLPLIGPIDIQGNSAALESPLWLCGGYTGHGMSMAFKAAHEAVDAMLRGSPPPFPRSRFAGNHC